MIGDCSDGGAFSLRRKNKREEESARTRETLGANELGPLDHCVNNVCLKDTWMNEGRSMSISVSLRGRDGSRSIC